MSDATEKVESFRQTIVSGSIGLDEHGGANNANIWLNDLLTLDPGNNLKHKLKSDSGAPSAEISKLERLHNWPGFIPDTVTYIFSPRSWLVHVDSESAGTKQLDIDVTTHRQNKKPVRLNFSWTEPKSGAELKELSFYVVLVQISRP